MSAPISPGGTTSASASRSHAIATRAPDACARSTKDFQSWSAPSVAGYWRMTPKTFLPKSKRATSATITSIGCAAARVRMTSIVCGWHWSDTSTARRSVAPLNDSIMCIASAAAVASSSSDALATSRPVRSVTTVWKLRSASSRPCETSAWYGVYWVYQPGFSRTLRRMTGGVTQSA